MTYVVESLHVVVAQLTVEIQTLIKGDTECFHLVNNRRSTDDAAHG